MKPLTAWGGIVLIPVIVIGGLLLFRRDVAQRNYDAITQMATTPASRTGDPNAVLPAGMTMQPPVEGTVSRDRFSSRASIVMRDTGTGPIPDTLNPVRATKAVLQRAKHLFDNLCAVCHGYSGAGDGPIIPKFPNPPSYQTPKSRALSDATMYKVISEGRLTMPAHAAVLTPEERWQLVLHIRSLQKPAK